MAIKSLKTAATKLHNFLKAGQGSAGILTFGLMVLTLSGGLVIAQDDAYRPPSDVGYGTNPDYPQTGNGQYDRTPDDYPSSPPARRTYESDDYRPRDESRRPPPDYTDRPRSYDGPPARSARPSDSGGYGEPYSAPDERRGYDDRGAPVYSDDQGGSRGTYSQSEIVNAGHGFFGGVSQGLASAVEWSFQRAGRPNGYILGQDAGGAIVAGLRYGEGVLYTKDAGTHKVFWQGPSLGYDFGAEGSKTMVLVYDMSDPSEIYQRFAGIEGSAYLVGGVSVQLQRAGNVTLAPIRSGVGVRLGANVGYLKYTRRPTWNPF